jgi:hypothetical protein
MFLVHQKLVVLVALTGAELEGSSWPKANVEVELENLHVPFTLALTVKVLVSAPHAAPPAASTASAMKNAVFFLMIASISIPGRCRILLCPETLIGRFRKKL